MGSGEGQDRPLRQRVNHGVFEERLSRRRNVQRLGGRSMFVENSEINVADSGSKWIGRKSSGLGVDG